MCFAPVEASISIFIIRLHLKKLVTVLCVDEQGSFFYLIRAGWLSNRNSSFYNSVESFRIRTNNAGYWYETDEFPAADFEPYALGEDWNSDWVSAISRLQAPGTKSRKAIPPVPQIMTPGIAMIQIEIQIGSQTESDGELGIDTRKDLLKM